MVLDAFDHVRVFAAERSKMTPTAVQRLRSRP